jgi:hypothetical protein
LKGYALVLYSDIDAELEKKFRIRIAEKYGGRQGAVTKALEEAIKLWLKSA